VLAGVGMLTTLAALVLPVPIATWVLLIGAVGVSVLLVAYSYLLWRQRKLA
jgi:hypothetical protein